MIQPHAAGREQQPPTLRQLIDRFGAPYPPADFARVIIVRRIDRGFAKRLVARAQQIKRLGPGWVHLSFQSRGGNPSEALKGMRRVKRILDPQVNPMVAYGGLVASAAVFVYAQADYRVSLSNFSMLIHAPIIQAPNVAVGTLDSHQRAGNREYATRLRDLVAKEVQLLVGCSNGRLRPGSIRRMLSREGGDTWLTPRQAFDFGLVDVVRYLPPPAYMTTLREQQPERNLDQHAIRQEGLLSYDASTTYGDKAPPFFVGELKDAAEKEPESFEDRKLLALYFDNDHAVAHNIFHTKVLCARQVSALLRNQFVVWPWDNTLPVNRERLDAYLDAAGMRAVHEMLERVKEDKFPLLIVVGNIGGKEKRRVPLVVILGRHDMETAMERLLIGLDLHMTTESMERSRRDLNDQFREDEQQEEDAAKAQRAREFSKAGAGESRRKEPPTAGEMLRRASLVALLPPEPDAAAREGVVTVKARLPDGGEASRRFPATSALSFLVHWLRSLGYDESRHKFLTSAQRDISVMDQSKSFASLGWMRREQVMVIDTA